jgi:hypothetical protein
MANSLAPGFIVINEHSEFGLHKRVLPTRVWTGLTGSSGTYVPWGGGTISDHDMVFSFVTKIKEVMVTTYHFDDYTVYTQADENSPPLPRFTEIIDIAGLLTAADAVPASQGTMTFRTAAFGKFKLTLLDAIPSGDFLPQRPGDFTTDQSNLALEIESDANAWQARDGSQITTLLRLTWTLNEKLRKAYRLT